MFSSSKMKIHQIGLYIIVSTLLASLSTQQTAGKTSCISTTTYCSKKITSVLTLEWRFETEKAFFKITKNGKGHAVIGPGTSMNNGDVWQVEKTGTTLELKDCNLVGYTSPDCAETNNLTIINQSATANSFTIEFSRPLTSTDSNKDKTLTPDSITEFIWSYTSKDTVEQHSGDTRGTTKIDLSIFDGGNIQKDWWGDGGFLIHEHGLIILWAIVCDLLIILGKNLKFLTRYFDAHSFAFLALAIIHWIFVFVPRRDRRRLLEETFEYNNTSHGERILASSFADVDTHRIFSIILRIQLSVIALSVRII